MEALVRRVAALEAGATSVARPAEAVPADPLGSSIERVEEGAPGLAALAGRTLLVLGGAYLLRFASESAWISPTLGTLAGVVYAVAWLVFADRAAAAGLRASATAHAVSTALIALPLTWESAVRFGTLSGSAAAILLFAVAIGAVVVGARHALPVLATVVVGAASLEAAVLLVALRSPSPFLLALLGLAAVSLVLSAARGWTILAIGTALVLDGAMLFVSAAAFGGMPDWLAGTPLPLFQMAFAALYLGAVAIGLGAGDLLVAGALVWVQAVFAFAIGFEAAVARLAPAHWPGGVAILVAAGFLFLARAAERQGREGGARAFPLIFALAFGLEAVRLLAGTTFLPWAAALAALLLALSATGERRALATALSALLVLVAAATSGLGRSVVAAFLLQPTGTAAPVARVAGLVLPFLLVAALLARERLDGGLFAVLRLVPLSLGVAGGGAVVLSLLLRSITEPPAVAVLRSAVLCAASILLALVHRRTELPEARWAKTALPWILVLQVFAQELRLGRAGPIVVGLLLAGLALSLAPRLGRTTAER